VKDWTAWEWPFFEPHHQDLARRAASWRAPIDDHEIDETSMAEACRAIARSLGQAGLLEFVVPPPGARIDVRSVCLIREALAYRSVLADSVFVMQGIGTAAIQAHGTEAQKARYLAPAREGKAIAAFALTEPASGSDVANLTTRADRDGDHFVLNGAKTYISNAPFADHYVVVARTGEAPGARGLSAFILDASMPRLWHCHGDLRHLPHVGRCCSDRHGQARA
jgi:acyl-CoA dehydrogenase